MNISEWSQATSAYWIILVDDAFGSNQKLDHDLWQYIADRDDHVLPMRIIDIDLVLSCEPQISMNKVKEILPETRLGNQPILTGIEPISLAGDGPLLGCFLIKIIISAYEDGRRN